MDALWLHGFVCVRECVCVVVMVVLQIWIVVCGGNGCVCRLAVAWMSPISLSCALMSCSCLSSPQSLLIAMHNISGFDWTLDTPGQ